MKLVIFGAGGFGREVLQLVQNINTHNQHAPPPRELLWPTGFLVDANYYKSPDQTVKGLQVHVLHGEWWDTWKSLSSVVVAVGDPRARRSIVAKLLELNPSQSFATLIHPQAWIGDKSVTLGEGTVVLPGARLTTDISVGRHCHLHLNTTMGHDCVVGDFCNVSPGSTLSGGTKLHAGVDLGTGVHTVGKLIVGCGTVLGAGSVVIGSLPKNVLAVGVPAQIKRDVPAW